MPYGEYRDENNASLGDTIPLVASIYDADNIPYDADSLLQVEFTIQKPNGIRQTLSGEINEDGVGVLVYEDTAVVGSYIAVAQFTLDTGELKSTRVDFDVSDPFDDATTPTQQLVDAVWLKLEDCFDSDEGGPWLRDVTKRFFNKRKIASLIPEGLLLINIAPPMTTAGIADFTFTDAEGNLDPDQSILVQAMLLITIKHLMRSYVEQPAPQGAQVVYEERRDYLERWGTIYQMELEYFNRILALWKRQFLGLGKSALLISSKAGRLVPAPMRTRHVGRGFM
jgi:hypothetical protein